jgi:hypothetical protein
LVAIDENASREPECGFDHEADQSLQDLGNPGPERRGFSFCPADEVIEREILCCDAGVRNWQIVLQNYFACSSAQD